MIRLQPIGVLWQKEWRNGLRDRRGFWLTVMMPLLVPVLMFLVFPLVIGLVTPRLKGDLLTIGVQGNLGSFEKSLSLPQQSALKLVGMRPLKVVPVDDAKASVQKGTFGMALRMPEQLPDTPGFAEPVEIEVYVDPASRSARASELLVRSALADFNKRMQVKRLQELGVAEANRDALQSRFVLVGEKGSISMMILGVILPMLIIVWGCTGAQWMAVDACAAERERGTFETLLVAPITRIEVLMAKYFATFSAAALSSVLGLLGIAIMFVALRQVVQSQFGPLVGQLASQFLGPVRLGLLDGIYLLISAVAVAMASSALVLLPSWFARTYREVQIYAVPGILSAMVLAGIGLAADFLGFRELVALVPISGAVAAMTQALSAQSTLVSTVVGALSSLVLAVLALWCMAAMLRRESVIFRN